MDDDLDANEEVNFFIFCFDFNFLLSGEKWSSQFVSLERSLFERTNAHHKNKQNSGSSIRKIL